VIRELFQEKELEVLENRGIEGFFQVAKVEDVGTGLLWALYLEDIEIGDLGFGVGVETVQAEDVFAGWNADEVAGCAVTVADGTVEDLHVSSRGFDSGLVCHWELIDVFQKKFKIIYFESFVILYIYL